MRIVIRAGFESNVERDSKKLTTAGKNKSMSQSSGLFIVIGGTIAAVSGIISVIVGHILEVRAEKARRVHELLRLKIESHDRHLASVWEAKLRVLSRFFSSTNNVYSAILNARKQRELEGRDTEYRAALKAISVREAQSSVEEVRLLTWDAATVASVDDLWQHLRSHDVPSGRATSGQQWHEWKEDYWKKRKACSELCRLTLGDREDFDSWGKIGR